VYRTVLHLANIFFEKLRCLPRTLPGDWQFNKSSSLFKAQTSQELLHIGETLTGFI
jgi:hypothetical protein